MHFVQSVRMNLLNPPMAIEMWQRRVFWNIELTDPDDRPGIHLRDHLMRSRAELGRAV